MIKSFIDKVSLIIAGVLAAIMVVVVYLGVPASLIAGALSAVSVFMAEGSVVNAVIMFFGASALTGLACCAVLIVFGTIVSVLVGEINE